MSDPATVKVLVKDEKPYLEKVLPAWTRSAHGPALIGTAVFSLLVSTFGPLPNSCAGEAFAAQVKKDAAPGQTLNSKASKSHGEKAAENPGEKALQSPAAKPDQQKDQQKPPEVSPSPMPAPVPKEKLESDEELMKNAPVKDSGETVRQLFSEGVDLLKKNRAYEARECLERAAYLAPRSAGIHCNLGLAYQNSGNINKAIGEFETALKLSASMPEATLNLAGCYQSVGDNENAINWYGKYLEENPKSVQAQQVTDIMEALKKSLGKAESDPHGPDYYSSVTREGIYRWAAERMPLRIYIEPGASVMGYFARFDDVLMEAFNEWCKASGGNISVTRVTNQNQADIFCSWTSNPQEVTVSGTQGERGSARIIAKGNNILRATLKILTKPFLEDGYLSDDDLKKACLHEVGHVLGLQGHSNNNHDVMFFTVDTSTVWPVLTKRDKATMARLYAPFVKKPEAAAATK